MWNDIECFLNWKRFSLFVICLFLVLLFFFVLFCVLILLVGFLLGEGEDLFKWFINKRIIFKDKIFCKGVMIVFGIGCFYW